MNVREAFEQCKAAAKHKRASSTARSYRTALESFQEYLETRNISQDDPIERLDMEAFIHFPDWLMDREYSKKTINVYVSGVRFLLSWLAIEGYIRPDFAQSERYKEAVKQVFRRRESKLPRWPKPGEVDRMVKAVYELDEPAPRYERNIAIVEFLFSSGCRANEITQLEIMDIDMTERSAVVTGKGKRERRVYFSQKAANCLREYWAARGYSGLTDPVFARHDRGVGKRREKLTTRTIQSIVGAVARQADIDTTLFTPHYFRHAFAITMLRETRDIALVQDLMGHSDPKSTRIYAKIYPDELRDAHRDVFG